MAEYGRGYSEKNLRRMMQFAEAFPQEEIVATLSRQLSWSHFSALLPLTQPLQREFYAEMCRIEGWSVRMLREQSPDVRAAHKQSRKPKQNWRRRKTHISRI